MLFSVTGMSSLTDGSGVHVMMFQIDNAAHGWLNDVIAVGEGSIDPDRGVLAMRYYARQPINDRARLESRHSGRVRVPIGSGKRG